MERKMFRDLSKDELNLIRLAYTNKNITKKHAQEVLAETFDVEERTIRLWANNLGYGLSKSNVMNSDARIMVYDIETSRVQANVWWTGKQYIGYNQLATEPSMISVAWKWLGEDEVFTLAWDKNHDDKTMLEEFLKEYNSADMVIGQNNDRFDNRWINARAMKHGLFVNVYVKSFDIMKQTKKLFRIPSYSMAYISKFLGVTQKQSHEGILMWEMIENGTPEQQEEYLSKMIEYNIGDIVTTEEMYFRLRKYMGHKVHFGVFNGGEKYSCPNCGSTNVELTRTTYTTAGTIQHIMRCLDDDCQYKISNRDYMKFLEDKFNGII